LKAFSEIIKMLIPEDSIEILVELGLTHTEAKAYVALLCLKTATARNIHTASNIARQNIYQLLSDLEEKGLIEKVIAKPAKFKPIPADKAISILLQRKKEQNNRLRKRAIIHFRNFEIGCAKTALLDKNAQFLLLSKSETNPLGHIDKLGKAVHNAKKSAVGLITFPIFMKVKLMDENIWKKAVRRGVKIQFIIARRTNEKSVINFDPLLESTNNFEIRWTRSLPTATVLLIDGNEAFCRVGTDVESPVLWSSSPQFVGMIKDYLKMKWQSLKQPREQLISPKIG
jgi:sugar-specific transcriptional regulator TrmB